MPNPIRTCVCCRSKFPQKFLTRLQCIDGFIVTFSGVGRSFYLCKDCTKKSNKNLAKSINRMCKRFVEPLEYEELLFEGKS